MKVLKIVAIVIVVLYVGIVILFESLLGYYQPAPGGTMVITTIDEEGTEFDRVVSQVRSGDTLYVAVNHWPRAWYYRTLDNPNVYITIDGERAPYTAIETEGEEYDRVNGEHARGLVFLFLTGFPPRHILRLEPREENTPPG